MEIGNPTFGDRPSGARGSQAAQYQLHEIVAAVKLADETVLHVFGVGEPHRSDYAGVCPHRGYPATMLS